MATENKILDLAWPASEDLSNDQYKFVVLTPTGVRRPDSETEVPVGILQNAPGAGEAASVRVMGVSKLQMNGAAGVGAFVMPEFVSAADAGKGKNSSGAPAYTRAMLLEASDAEDDLASALLAGFFPAINDAVAHATTVATVATAGPRTYTAAELAGGLILRDPAGAARSDVTPSAADLAAAIPGAAVGSGFELVIRNTADAAETITLTAGNGVTLSGTMTIEQNNSRRFLVVCTNVGAGTEAATVYSMGSFVH